LPAAGEEEPAAKQLAPAAPVDVKLEGAVGDAAGQAAAPQQVAVEQLEFKPEPKAVVDNAAAADAPADADAAAADVLAAAADVLPAQSPAAGPEEAQAPPTEGAGPPIRGLCCRSASPHSRVYGGSL
jgi:hypothetical protein